MKVAVIIPAKNEAKKIAEVVRGIKNLPSLDYDVIVIDDGSIDATAQLAAGAGATVLRHLINRGQGAAIRTGINYALINGQGAAVFFDADGQMEPAEIPLLLAKLDSGYDVVLGSRNIGRVINMPLRKKIVKKIALIFTRFTTGLKLTDTHNGFQAWTAPALRQITLVQDRFAYASEVLEQIAKHGLKYCEVPVTITYSEYSKRKGQSILGAINIIFDLLIKK
jgi:glycosyltransferase involved in cell wall biosynthesis